MDEIAITDPLAVVTWPVATERLTIRPARDDDASTLWEYRRREDVSRWISYLPTVRADWDALFAEPERRSRTLIVECDGQVVGDLFLKVEDAVAQREALDQARGTQAEIGWCLDPAHTGNGYATEAARALMRLCFDVLGLRRVVANAFADNEASWRIMERLGMRRETYSVRESLHRDRGWLDGVSYALLADEWER